MDYVFYHGTAVSVPGERREFSIDPPVRTTMTAGNALGIFFARFRPEAEAYADAAVSEGVGVHPVVVEAHLRITHPLTMTVRDFYEKTEGATTCEIEQYRQELMALGYDAVFVGETGDIVVFQPSQVQVLQAA